MEIKIRSRWERPIRKVETFSAVKPVYAYDKKARSLVEVGKRDFNEYVNSCYELSLLSNKLKRFQNGDLSALNSRKGVFIDISGMPTDYNTLHNMVVSAMTDVEKSGCKDIPEYIQLLLKTTDDEKLEENIIEKPVESEVIENE